MKILKYLAIIFSCFFLFIVCRKEPHSDNKPPITLAKGSLKDSLNNCMAIITKGMYAKNIVLADSNYIIVQINFTAPGNYSISTDTSNGFSFHGSGNATKIGLQKIILKGTGNPTFEQLTNFLIIFGSDVCTFSINVHDPARAKGSLKDSSGNCMAITTNGKYSKNTALTDSNYIVVQVNFTTFGSYSISSDSTNGFSFQGSGITAHTGVQSIILKGNGKPIEVGVSYFSVSFDSIVCAFSVIVNYSDSSLLKDISGNCRGITTNGNYLKNTSLTDSNYIVVQVNFKSPGSYNISTNTSNGFSFQGSGNATHSGIQSITLKGTGKPVAPHITNFSVFFNSDVCTFSINVLDSAIIHPTALNDYFPTSNGSNWTYLHMGALDYYYDVGVSESDTIIAGNVYKIFVSTWLDYNNSYSRIENYYRKANGLYYEYGYINQYSIYLTVNDKVEFIFLKDNVSINSTWESPEVSATLYSIPGKLKIKSTIIGKGMNLVLGEPATLDSVITVKRQFMFAPSATGEYVGGDTATFVYAKNIGFIHGEAEDRPLDPGASVTRWEIFY